MSSSPLWRVIYRVHWTDSTARTWVGFAADRDAAKALAITEARKIWTDHTFAVLSAELV